MSSIYSVHYINFLHFTQYFLGKSTKSDGTPLYGELDQLPAEAPVVEAVEDELPRVEELLDEVEEEEVDIDEEELDIDVSVPALATGPEEEDDLPELNEADVAVSLGDIKMNMDASEVMEDVEDAEEDLKAEVEEVSDDVAASVADISSKIDETIKE
jgi:hypothetical protein